MFYVPCLRGDKGGYQMELVLCVVIQKQAEGVARDCFIELC